MMKVILVMAMSVDGKIARHPEHFPDWTEKADKRFFVQVTKQAGALIMGSKTYDTIGRPLPGRLNVVMTRRKNRHARSRPPELLFTGAPPRQLLADLAARGFTEVVLAGGATINNLFAEAGLIDELHLTVAPMIFGEGISLFSRETDLELELLEMTRLGEKSVRLHYRMAPGRDGA